MIELNNTYGKYKKIRNATWQTLIDNRITELPINIARIIQNNNIQLIKNSQINILHQEDGICIYDGKWSIVYNDSIKSVGRKRFTIAHELAHILLGHPLAFDKANNVLDKEYEKDADSFAIRLLSPACVLWGLDLRIPDQIASTCQISRQAAIHRSKRMEELYRRNKFLLHPLEKKLYAQFQDYINEKRREHG